MIYLQQKSFEMAVAGVVGDYVFVRGWLAPVNLLLQSIVDPSIRGTAVAMHLFNQAIVYVIAVPSFGYLLGRFGLDKDNHPKEFGQLCAAFTIIPLAISIPLFIIGGFKHRNTILANALKN